MEETWALVQGVEECGGGKWADIKRHNYKAIEKRTAVGLRNAECCKQLMLTTDSFCSNSFRRNCMREC